MYEILTFPEIRKKKKTLVNFFPFFCQAMEYMLAASPITVVRLDKFPVTTFDIYHGVEVKLYHAPTFYTFIILCIGWQNGLVKPVRSTCQKRVMSDGPANLKRVKERNPSYNKTS